MYLSHLTFKLDWPSRYVPGLNLANIVEQSLFLFPKQYFYIFLSIQSITTSWILENNSILRLLN